MQLEQQPPDCFLLSALPRRLQSLPPLAVVQPDKLPNLPLLRLPVPPNRR